MRSLDCQAMLTVEILGRWIQSVDCCPWATMSGRGATPIANRPLYTPEQRRRRDASRWTIVQGVLAPLQFLVFLVSLTLVLRTLFTGEGFGAATVSIVVKTGVLYLIMVTGSVWERDVFGRYLFAPAFFWEDVCSMLVLALHTAYLIGLFSHTIDPHRLMFLALCAYAAYLINASQFLVKLRAARRETSANESAFGLVLSE
ncbi:MAG TPA: 2-vinyl bacteriochlorophyllide hydratase [Acetobacteraceae bacterium]|nr:2-vinyl bacteriochlorophyllide hydratase [Acetobacteraceae bacterium]